MVINFSNRRQFFEFAAKNRLPTMCGRAGFVEAGGLMSYAASREDSCRRAAYFVDKILKGTKPADLPVQQPTNSNWSLTLGRQSSLGLRLLLVCWRGRMG